MLSTRLPASRATTSAVAYGPFTTASVSTKLRRNTAHNPLRSATRSVTSVRARSASHPVVCVKDISESEFDQEVLQSDKPVLVDFWATWCGPCKLVGPSVDQIAEEFADVLKVVKMETDPNPNIVEKYKVYGLPTLILFKDGTMIPGSKVEGAISKKKIIAYLEQHAVVGVAS